ncbi:hypothetical protein [Thalassobacillus devorans]|uniref:hypothetical protein n=1 Tax=Thalassobacillus devorans TaxID=279813 RepID=UPI000A1C861C|nr:hypothetical protein [Thalassobacillus devorans]
MSYKIVKKSDENQMRLLKFLKRIFPYTLLVTILSFINYGLGYTFLYGFFIGGDLNKETGATMDLFINPAPFDFYAVSLMGLFISLSVLLLMTLIYHLLFKVNEGKIEKLRNSFIVFVLFCGFQYCLTLFLITGFNGSFIIYFKSFIIWLIPFAIAIVLGFIMMMYYSWHIGITGMVIGILLPGLLSEKFGHNSSIFLREMSPCDC